MRMEKFVNEIIERGIARMAAERTAFTSVFIDPMIAFLRGVQQDIKELQEEENNSEG